MQSMVDYKLLVSRGDWRVEQRELDGHTEFLVIRCVGDKAGVSPVGSSPMKHLKPHETDRMEAEMRGRGFTQIDRDIVIEKMEDFQ